MSTGPRGPVPAPPPQRAEARNPFNDRPTIRWMDAVLQHFRTLTLVGLPDLKDRPDVATEALYVPLWLGLGSKEARAEDAIVEHGRVIALGDPGSGKSTLISWLCVSTSLRLAETQRTAVRQHVPFPIVLRDLKLDRSVQTFEALLERAAAQPWWAGGWTEGLRSWLETGPALLMVDGLDEVSDVEVRKGVCAAVRDAARKYPNLRILVTSRRVGYDEAPVEVVEKGEGRDRDAMIVDGLRRSLGWHGSDAFTRMEVLPFNQQQITWFAQRWYAVRMGGAPAAEEQAKKLVSALDDGPGLKALATNPSLLALMALVHRVFTQLPSGRAILFEKMTEAYLESIDRARRLPTLEQPWRVKQRWLARIATAIQEQRRSGSGELHLERARALAILTEVVGLAEVAKQFLEEVLRRSGILVPRTETTVAFGHLSFQEYLAAVQLVEELQQSVFDDEVRVATLKKARAWALDAEGREPMVLAFELLAQGSPAAAAGLYKQIRSGVEKEKPARQDAFAALVAGLQEDSATTLGELGDARGIQKEAVKRALALGGVPPWCRSLEILDGDPSVTELRLHAAETSPRYSFRGLERLKRLTALRAPDGNAIDFLPSNARLRELSLEIGNRGNVAKVIARYAELTDLSLWASGRTVPLDLGPLLGLRRLASLSVSDLALQDLAILRDLPVSRLWLHWIRGLDLPRSVLPWSDLTNLWLNNCRVWSPELIAPLTRLAALDLRSVHWVELGPRMLPFFPSLRTLRLRWSGLTDLSSLTACPHLERITLPADAPERALIPDSLRHLIKDE